MKEIKYISFSEMLLIPLKSKFENSDYPFSHYKGYICGKNEESSTTVHLLLFNCTKREEIPCLVDSEIEDLKKYISENPHVEEIKSQIEFFLKLKEELNNSALHHTPSEELIQFVSSQCVPEIKKENVVFLSGVRSLIEG